MRHKRIYTLDEVEIRPLNPRMQTGDATGEKYYQLTVIGFAGNLKWWCQCDCGNIVKLWIGAVRKGHTKSCGCRRRESTIERNTTHGQAYHPLYQTWKNMMGRCYYTNMRGYEHWGGRGIKVHEAWHKDPVAFFTWVEKNLGPRPKNHSLDRIDNDGDYEPGNLRWASYDVQNRNRG